MSSQSDFATQLLSCQSNGTCDSTFWPFLPESLFTVMTSLLPNFECNPWVSSAIGSIVIGLSGIFPLLVIPVEEGVNLKNGAGGKTLKILLSFAVGCLLGDVFLHLLPEVWQNQEEEDHSAAEVAFHPGVVKGLWVIAGLLVFVFLEKVFTFSFDSPSSVVPDNKEAVNLISDKSNGIVPNGYVLSVNNNIKGNMAYGNGRAGTPEYVIQQYSPAKTKNLNNKKRDITDKQEKAQIHISGYLNLMANSFDNFSHGLAVGGSFLVSFPSGVFTTLAILLHEIPHEVGDFAILLKSGFSRWEAAKAQMCTACAGLLGSFAAISLSGASDSVEARTSWILPFTAGGFLHIALVTVLPDLMKEENPKESFLQMLSLFGGICVMALLSLYAE